MGRVASVCDLHRVPCGSPEHLDGFLRVLESNKLLAMDFWGIMGGVGAIQDAIATRGFPNRRPAESMTSEQLEAHTLEAIIRVVTGMTITETLALGGGVRRSVEELTALIAGEDTSFPAGTGASARAEVTDSDGNQNARRDAYQDTASRANDGGRLNGAGGQNGRANGDGGATRASSESWTAPAGGGTAVEDREETTDGSAWSRVLSTDWKAVESQAAQSAAQSSKGAQRVVVEPVRRVVYGDRDLRRVLLQGERPQVIEGSAATERSKKKSGFKLPKLKLPAIQLPAWATDPRRLATIVLTAGMVAGLGAAAMKAHKTGLLREMGASVRSTLSQITSPNQAQSGSAAAISATKADGANAAHRQKAVVSPVKLVTMADASQAPGADSGAKAPATGGQAAGSTQGTGATGSKADGSPMEVFPEVMKANLIESKAPAATRLGKGDGRVVLRVGISKYGTIENLRVVEGDPVLGLVATEAVWTWRYRPYLVNGVPVAVTTVVTVAVKVEQ